MADSCNVRFSRAFAFPLLLLLISSSCSYADDTDTNEMMDFMDPSFTGAPADAIVPEESDSLEENLELHLQANLEPSLFDPTIGEPSAESSEHPESQGRKKGAPLAQAQTEALLSESRPGSAIVSGSTPGLYQAVTGTRLSAVTLRHDASEANVQQKKQLEAEEKRIREKERRLQSQSKRLAQFSRRAAFQAKKAALQRSRAERAVTQATLVFEKAQQAKMQVKQQLLAQADLIQKIKRTTSMHELQAAAKLQKAQRMQKKAAQESRDIKVREEKVHHEKATYKAQVEKDMLLEKTELEKKVAQDRATFQKDHKATIREKALLLEERKAAAKDEALVAKRKQALRTKLQRLKAQSAVLLGISEDQKHRNLSYGALRQSKLQLRKEQARLKVDKQKASRLKKRMSEVSDKSTARMRHQTQIVSQLVAQQQKLTQEVQRKTAAAQHVQSELIAAKVALKEVRVDTAAAVEKKQLAQMVATSAKPASQERDAPASQFAVVAEKIKKPTTKSAVKKPTQDEKEPRVKESAPKAERTLPSKVQNAVPKLVQTPSQKPLAAVATSHPASHNELVAKMRSAFKQLAKNPSAKTLAAASSAAAKVPNSEAIKAAAAKTVHVTEATVASTTSTDAQPTHAKQIPAQAKQSPILLTQAVKSQFSKLENEYMYAQNNYRIPGEVKQLLLAQSELKLRKFVVQHSGLRKRFAEKYPELAHGQESPMAAQAADAMAAAALATVVPHADAQAQAAEREPIVKTIPEMKKEHSQREVEEQQIALVTRYEKTRGEYEYAKTTDGVPEELRKELRSQVIAMKPQYKKYSEALAQERSLRLLEAAQTGAPEVVPSEAKPTHQDDKVSDGESVAPLEQLSEESEVMTHFKKLKADFEYAKTNQEIPESLKQSLLAQYATKLQKYVKQHPEVQKLTPERKMMNKLKKSQMLPSAQITLITHNAAPIRHTGSVAVSKRIKTLRDQYTYAKKTPGFPAALRKEMAAELQKLELEAE